MTRLVLIRHGETDWNREARYQGQADPPLNAMGRRQAQALVEVLRPLGMCCLYSSPLQRAWETARVVAEALHLPLYPEPRLKEIHLGEWEGLTVDVIQARYPEHFARWQREPWTTAPPGGERVEAVFRRVLAAVRDIVMKHPRDTVGLVTHRMPIVLLKIHVLGLPRDVLHTLPVPNAGWEILEVEPEKWGFPLKQR